MVVPTGNSLEVPTISVYANAAEDWSVELD
jgi:hypothetical protein